MNKKFWIGFIILVIGVMAFAVYSSKKGATTTRRVEDPTVVQADDHIRGKVDSENYLIVYGDFECPVCNSWEPSLQKIEQDYSDRVAFIFRHNPITSAHVNALAASRAAVAADKQGKFWEMHDLLYLKWNEWRGDVRSAQGKFEGYASELGLDLEQFKSDYKSKEVADRINSDFNSGNAFIKDEDDVTGTPTFYINGVKFEPGAPGEGEAKIRAELDRILGETSDPEATE